VTLKFPGNKIGQFMVSYNLADVDEYHLAGSEGFLRVQPGFMFGMALEHHLLFGPQKGHEKFSETDHFGGETKYFSQCIIDGIDPEPDGEEGWCDVRVIEAIRKSLETGQPVMLEPYTRAKRIEMDQLQELSPVSVPKFVNAEKPAA
jgi:predicted dehydrogenase